MTGDSDGWVPYDDGGSIGEAGSDGGVIVRDEEYRGAARITLERGGFAAFSITCGVYGWMVHSRYFAALPEAEREYDAMRPALAAIVDALPLAADPGADAQTDAAIDMLGRFVDRFP